MSGINAVNDTENKWFCKNTLQLSYFRIWSLFSIITLLSYVYQYPAIAAVFPFMFGDPGGALKVDYLIAQGYSPTIDFTYNYGLLTLSIGRIWFEIFGRTPQSYLGGMLFFNILLATALAKIAIVSDLRRIGIIFIACTIPFSVMPSYPNFAHPLEAFLICFALGEHICGRKSYALIALTFSLFVKPSMSYIYIFIILIIYTRDILRRRTQVITVFTQILPAGLTFIFLAVLMGINFGIMPIFNSIIPIAGSQNYRASNYGFFTGTGKYFWHPPQVKISYFLGTITGFWLLTTVILFISVIYFSWRIITKKIDNLKIPLLEIQLCILLLHLSFILFLFGNSWSWFYYSYLLPIGVSFLASHRYHDLKKIRMFLLCILISSLFLGYKAIATVSYQDWRDTRPQKSIIGLYTTSDYQKEFMNVVESCEKENTLILSSMGATDLFFTKCHMPILWYIGPPFNNPLEIARLNQQFSQAKSVIIPQGVLDEMLRIKTIKLNLEKFQLLRITNFFNIFKLKQAK